MMRNSRIIIIIAFSVLPGLSHAQGHAAAVEPLSDDEQAIVLSLSPLNLPRKDPTNELSGNELAISFGRSLFFDKRLSVSSTRACASCHDPNLSWTDGKAVPEGGSRNTPSLWNVVYNRWYSWDGGADTLWAQATRPIENAKEMGLDRFALTKRIYNNDDLRRGYETVHGKLREPVCASDPAITNETCLDPERADATKILVNVAKSLAAYLETIISNSSAFDKFVEGLRTGNTGAVQSYPEAASRGLRVFLRSNCHLCHSGPNFTDGEFHDIGVSPKDGTLPTDPGRFEGIHVLTESEFRSDGGYSAAADPKLRFIRAGPDVWAQFKTPSLRNVVLSAPYMHNGQIATIDDVIDHYSNATSSTYRHVHLESTVKPLHLTSIDRSNLIAFLESLTDPVLIQNGNFRR
ncbi:cytochrome c peroxidase [Bradyrhizobium sp. 18]|uniref:cytochrome-c peroxidase n=1 Tax=Bradyrhizobium sp. 18 TaxID=2782657 RepID=UPI001FF9144A|nr:cytochrome c peroxidase [Bradyrhizobium sp. 18]MCK1505676.1 hypothetical protein [Bradyrhizobium sp. 18]